MELADGFIAYSRGLLFFPKDDSVNHYAASTPQPMELNDRPSSFKLIYLMLCNKKQIKQLLILVQTKVAFPTQILQIQHSITITNKSIPNGYFNS
jgi:hypothetical protein